MAIETYMAYADDDWASLDACVALLKETGHPMSKRTLGRLLTRRGVRTELRREGGSGRTRGASFSSVLELHRDWVDGQDRLN
ncbi:hypothetical protein [Streptomyces sp. 8L]|uniref:hypothetical protein n=1 Tax=Streptomyces sp. 8L TaxID=2877242 RepID=UPI001CD2C52C|nr:hypothetical protein [Streptomyces sp. 8L]MCA1224116.1 hypothetical protein [Streptomyces sp. 8L]